MSSRIGRLLVLVGFVLATGTQYLLHAHLDGHHHEAGCTDELAVQHHDHPTAAHPCHVAGVADTDEFPASHHHGACPTCCAPAADLRSPTGVLAAGTAVAGCPSLAVERVASTLDELGYDLRGPPSVA